MGKEVKMQGKDNKEEKADEEEKKEETEKKKKEESEKGKRETNGYIGGEVYKKNLKTKKRREGQEEK